MAYDDIVEYDEPTMDELHGMDIDWDVIEREGEESLKEGSFGKREKHVFTEGHYRIKPPGQYKMRDDLEGYTVASYWPVIYGEGQEDRFGFDLCPVKYTNKFNRTAPAYTRFTQAYLAYKAVVGEKPKHVEDLYEFVATYPHLVLHLGVGSTGKNFVYSLRAVAPETIE